MNHELAAEVEALEWRLEDVRHRHARALAACTPHVESEGFVKGFLYGALVGLGATPIVFIVAVAVIIGHALGSGIPK